MEQVRDRTVFNINGFIPLGSLLLLLILWLAGGGLATLVDLLFTNFLAGLIVAGLILTLTVLLGGFIILQPNEAAVVLFFGSYLGTVRQSGFRFTVPLTLRKKVSLRFVNHTTPTLKVNDLSGNPIEIAAVVVWRVKDAAQALLNVDDYHSFVTTQTETAVRTLAARFPYDQPMDGGQSLRSSPEEVSAALITELQERLNIAGIVVEEARLSHLAYAPEIASAMLRRQQAEAIVSARQIITENAVNMAEEAIRSLESQGLLKGDEAGRTRLIGNLLVALVAERDAQPTIEISD